MGLVDHKERRSKGTKYLEFAFAFDKESFRRGVKEFEVLVGQELIADLLFNIVEIAINKGRGDFESEERGNLFTHERLQGRNNNADA